jgi:hypothetical protein
LSSGLIEISEKAQKSLIAQIMKKITPIDQTLLRDFTPKITFIENFVYKAGFL